MKEENEYLKKKLLRNQIHKEYHELNLASNFKFYNENKSSLKLYYEYRKAISDMNKYAGNLSYNNLNSYLYDVSSYASLGLFSCKSRLECDGITTNDFFKD